MADEDSEDDPEGEARGRIQAQIKALEHAESGTIDGDRRERLKLMLEDAEVGFTSGEAIEELQKLNFTQMQRLAAMALRFYDNCWTDSKRDLMGGLKVVLGRESEVEKMYGGGE
jgi:hypothetical protein